MYINRNKNKSSQLIGGIDLSSYDDIDEINDEVEFSQSESDRTLQSDERYQRGIAHGRQLQHSELQPQFEQLTQQHSQELQRIREHDVLVEHQQQHALINELDELNKITQRYILLDRQLPCEQQSNKLIECYKTNDTDPLQCKSIVDQYSQCANNAQINALKGVQSQTVR